MVFISYSYVLKNIRIRYEEKNDPRRISLRTFFVVGVFILSAGLGMLRFDVVDLNKGSPILDERVGKEVVLRGIMVDEPDVRETHTKITFKPEVLENIQLTGRRTSSQLENGKMGKILVVAKHFPEFQYGDELILRGKLEKPKNFSKEPNDSGRAFNYVAYLEKDGIFYQMFYPDIEYVKSGEGNAVKSTLLSVKRALIEKGEQVLPEPHSSLLGGILLGIKRSLGEDLLRDFRVTGIIHIVVLSGYNITIVAEAIGRAASFLPRILGLSLSVLSIIAFAVMTGAGATVVRASLMALLVLLARSTGRIYEITIALFAAGFVMVFWNPKILVFDPSFQLSFLATVGLIQLAPRLEKFFGFLPTRFQFREFALATISTQLFVLPLLLYMMGELSLVALPVNLLVLLFIPLTMLFGFLAMVFGFVHTIIALPFAWIAYALLAYELAVVDVFSALPFASMTISNFPLWAMFFVYICYGIFLYKTRNK